MSELTGWKKELVRLAPYYANALDQPLDDGAEETLEEMRELGIELPAELIAFLAVVNDSEMIDLQPLGGRIQHLHDLFGVLEANHPEEGSYGNLVAEGEIPKGVVMIGYGMTQLLYDGVGALGPKGSFWSTSDMIVDKKNATQLATSLDDLLARAAPRPTE